MLQLDVGEPLLTQSVQPHAGLQQSQYRDAQPLEPLTTPPVPAVPPEPDVPPVPPEFMVPPLPPEFVPPLAPLHNPHELAQAPFIQLAPHQP